MNSEPHYTIRIENHRTAEWVSVELMDGHEVVAKQGARYARPGEMVTLQVPQKAYDAVNKADRLSVRVRER